MAEFEFHDFSEVDGINQLKAEARRVLLEEVVEFLKTRYADIYRVAENEYAVVVGQAKDEDKFVSDVTVVLRGTTKPWYNNEDCRRPVVKYDPEQEAELYAMEIKAKDCSKK